ncbi:tetratricopeptide repeat protein [Syntrophotalea carbinolica]|nr:hypothetical protein [Syntrophotalea carbinolica]
MIKLRLLVIVLLLIGSVLPVRAADVHRLQNLTKVDEFDQSRVVFDFSKLPEFHLETSGQRVDLLFQQTDIGSSLTTLPEDDKIVKVLLARKQEELLVSILLHKIPTRVATIESPARQQITLDIRWPTEGAQRPAVAFQLSGMPTAHKSLDSIATPQLNSVYTGRWQDFFKVFHTRPDIQTPMQYSLPALPSWPTDRTEPILHKALKLANSGKWQTLAAELKQAGIPVTGHPGAELKAEALLRTGHAKRAVQILNALKTEEGDAAQPARANYLCALAEAASGAPYQARCSLAPVLAASATTSPLTPYARLLEAELLLAIGKHAQAYALLKKPVQHWPNALQRTVQWRRSQALLHMGKKTKAARGFRRMYSRPDLHARFPDIRYDAGLSCLETGRYKEAEVHFVELSQSLHDPIQHGNAEFCAAKAAYLAKDRKRALVSLEQLRDNYEGTETGFFAWMALLDHRFSNQENVSFLQIARDYGTIAENAPLRSLREEAAIKQALVHHLHNQQDRAAALLKVFLRNFSRGPFQKEAKTLLSEILPPLIEKLIRDGHDLEAVVMVEEHRDLLIDGNLSWSFLPDLAQAYTRLGLWQKASKTYFFLIDRKGAGHRDKAYYLPLVQLLHDRSQYAMAISLARRYLEKYPSGKDRLQLFELQLMAMAKSNRLDEAVQLLQKYKHLTNADIALQSAVIHWKQGNSRRIIQQPKSLNDTPEGLLLRAEALFKETRNAEALDLYEQLRRHKTYADQATYRCGQIKLLSGDNQSALKLFRQVAENKQASFWARLAKDAIAAHDMKRSARL